MRAIIQAVIPQIYGPNYMQGHAQRLVTELDNTMKLQVRPFLQTAFKKRVARWKNKPYFVGRLSHPTGSISLLVAPEGKNAQKWGWVSGGVAGRTIHAVRKPLLRFRRKYSPHTRPGNVYGGSGRRSGKWVSAKSVQWTGIQSRDFEQHILAETQVQILAMLAGAIARAFGP